uniref:Snurportin-1 n=1 Tax=Panagrellus redivivus TaxID=6233 RepID=A0A7E4V8Z8_PANRE
MKVDFCFWDELGLCDDKNLDGYLVTMTTGCVFRIHYDGKDMAVNAKYELLPWKKTVEVDVGEVPEVNVYMLFKHVRFTSNIPRKVARYHHWH